MTELHTTADMNLDSVTAYLVSRLAPRRAQTQL